VQGLIPASELPNCKLLYFHHFIHTKRLTNSTKFYRHPWQKKKVRDHYIVYTIYCTPTSYASRVNLACLVPTFFPDSYAHRVSQPQHIHHHIAFQTFHTFMLQSSCISIATNQNLHSHDDELEESKYEILRLLVGSVVLGEYSADAETLSRIPLKV